MATKAIFDDITPWPDKPKPAQAVVGHNKPPVEDEARAAFREALITDRPDFEQKVEDIVAAADRCNVVDDESYGKGGSFIKLVRAATDHVAMAHKVAKDPYLNGGRAVDAEKNALTARLSGAAGKVQVQLNNYAAKKAAEAEAERQRIAAEQRAAADRAAEAERARQQAEADAARAIAEAANEDEKQAALERAFIAADEAEQAMAAAALAPAPVASGPIRSDDGATVSTKTVWNSAVDDHAKAFKAVKSDPKVKEAIEAAIARLVRAGQRDIAGCRIWPTQQAVAR